MNPRGQPATSKQQRDETRESPSLGIRGLQVRDSQHLVRKDLQKPQKTFKRKKESVYHANQARRRKGS